MFGRDWEPATAKIVATKFKEAGERSGAYVADITPSSGLSFRARLKQPPFMSHVVRLSEGEAAPVLADVKHQKAKFDRSDPLVSGKGQPTAKDSFNEALAEPPGSPPPGDIDSR
jgi:hypothetical protein